MRKSTISILLILLSSVQAQEVSKVSTTANTGDNLPEKTWSLALNNTFETNLYKESDVDHSLMSYTSLGISWKLDDGYKFGIGTSLDKNLKGDREHTINNAGLSLSLPALKINEQLTFAPKLGLTIPVTDSSVHTQSLKTSATASGSLVFNASEFIDGLSLIYSPLAKANFHEFETASSGKVNTQYTLKNSFIIGYGITENLSLSLLQSYTRNFDYFGDSSDSFGFDQSLSYAINGNFGISLGHSIGGNALHEDGSSSDVRVFDSESSTIYTGIDFTY